MKSVNDERKVIQKFDKWSNFTCCSKDEDIQQQSLRDEFLEGIVGEAKFEMFNKPTVVFAQDESIQLIERIRQKYKNSSENCTRPNSGRIQK